MSERMKDAGLHIVEGVRFPAVFPEEKCRSALMYKPKSNDVFVVTYPKCGTNWTGEIVTLIFRKGDPLATTGVLSLSSPFLDLVGAKAVENAPRPCVIKTHIPFHVIPWSSDAKYIYVVRNPKDCCVSYYHHMKNIPGLDYKGTFDEFFEEFFSGKSYYGDYFDHVLGWYEHRNDNNVLFLTYESIKENPKNAILKIASFLSEEEYLKPLTVNEDCLNNIIKHSSFETMKEKVNKGMGTLMSLTAEEMSKVTDLPEEVKQFYLTMGEKGRESKTLPPTVHFIRKGIIGDWKNHFSQEQSKRLDEKFLERTKGTELANWWKNYM